MCINSCHFFCCVGFFRPLLINYSEIVYLFPMTSWVYLSFSSDSSIPSCILCRSGLVVINSFNLFLLQKIFISPSSLIDTVAGCSNLDFGLSNCGIHLSRPFLVVKCLLNFQILFWWANFISCLTFLTTFNTLSLFCVSNVLTIPCCGKFLFWFCLFGVFF